MQIEYRIIDISNIAGLNKVDSLLRNGWTVHQNGMFRVVLQKKS